MPKKTTSVLLILIGIDSVFILLHILYSINFLENKGFKINQDGGFGEIYQYFKFISASVILLYLSKIMRSKLLLFWSILAFFLFLDDWMRVHEIIGGKIVGSQLFDQDSYHHGQIVYGAIFAILIGLIGVYFWQKSTDEVKKLSILLFISLGLLWFSAVVIDYLHAIWIPKQFKYNLIGVLIEEGGEHLSASLFLWFCFQALITKMQSGVQAGKSLYVSNKL